MEPYRLSMIGLGIHQEYHGKEMYLGSVEKQKHLLLPEDSPPAASSKAARWLFAFDVSSHAGQRRFSDLFTQHG